MSVKRGNSRYGNGGGRGNSNSNSNRGNSRGNNRGNGGGNGYNRGGGRGNSNGNYNNRNNGGGNRGNYNNGGGNQNQNGDFAFISIGSISETKNGGLKVKVYVGEDEQVTLKNGDTLIIRDTPYANDPDFVVGRLLLAVDED